MRQLRIAALGLGTMLAGALLAPAQLTLEPARDAGNSVTGALEGWFKNPDGTFNILVGYYNRNRKQELDIPIGPNNFIEPGGPDHGQPTHFMSGRGWGLFVIQVPADFGDKKFTWTIVANGKTTVIPLSLKTDWEVSPLIEAGVGNTPPVLSFDEHGPTVQGPLALTAERTAKAGEPLPITVWVSDDAKFTSSSGSRPKNLGTPVTLHWVPYRTPGHVTLSAERPEVQKIERPGSTAPFNGKATITATFSEPGDYVLHVTANDYSGEGGSGFQCCWTTGMVKVAVQP